MKAFKLGIESTGHYECSIGGWNCLCCAPKKDDRPKARRSVRRLMNQQDAQMTKDVYASY